MTVLYGQIFILNLYCMIITVCYEGSTFDMTDNGLFGFMAAKNTYLCCFWNAVFCGLGGTCGYMISLNFFSPLFIANCLLMEPIVGQTIGIVLGIEAMPGPLTVFALIWMIVGLNVIRQGSIMLALEQ